MTEAAAQKFIKRFDEPITHQEIDGLALNSVALRVAAGLDSPSSSAIGAD